MRKCFRKKAILVLIVLMVILIGMVIGNKTKSLPEGLSYESEVYYTDDITFLSDLTYTTDQGDKAVEQVIFNEVFNTIKEAEEFVVVDMFLFNDITDQDRDFPDLSGELTEALINQKEKYPNLQIVFITDPINTGYHSYKENHMEQLKEHGMEVVITSLSELRDSNALYTSVWRLFFQLFGQSGHGWLPNPFADDAPKLTLRSYLELFNVKANHRKVLVTEKNAIISSANPHNESGFASNIAFKVSGDIIHEIVEAEQAVLHYSGGKTVIDHTDKVTSTDGNIAIQYLTEGKILQHLIVEIDRTEKDDTIWLGMFYIANRGVIDALHRATERGAQVQMILDPNKAAFGNNKMGLPNVPVSSELVKDDNVSIRWYEAEEDQYHTKLLYIKKQDEAILIGGSANHTTRNLDNLNLEANLKVTAPLESQVIRDVDIYFNRLWNNEDGIFTADYESNEDILTPALKLTYWVQKISGLTTY